MRRKTAVIADAEKLLSKRLTKKLSQLGYKVKVMNGSRKMLSDKIDLLISGTCRYETVSPVINRMKAENSGSIIYLGSTVGMDGEKMNSYIRSSEGYEYLLREQIKGTAVKLSFVHQCFTGYSFMEDINSRYRIHSFDTRHSADKLANAVVELAASGESRDICFK